MSYRCDKCCKAFDGMPTRVVLERREFTHPKRFDAFDRLIDRGGKGSQIVREADMCGNCAAAAGFILDTSHHEVKPIGNVGAKLARELKAFDLGDLEVPPVIERPKSVTGEWLNGVGAL